MFRVEITFNSSQLKKKGDTHPIYSLRYLLNRKITVEEPIKRRCPPQCLNCQVTDETGLFWKVLPDKTYVHSGERSGPGRKISKERITFLVCSNASGSKKIKPLLIGKSRSTRAFRNKTLPVDYTHSKNAWMTCTLFKTWFFNNFVPQVEEFLAQNNLPLNAILLLDNAPSHPPAEELVKQTHSGKIWAHYMPPNVTPLIQPMDQNAIRLLKLHYKNSLLSRLFSTPEQNVSLFFKAI
ncbi:jerky protein homolog-like [Lucilia cuprina]|uniref:jerky protein homolog-like n=1 Tax=Lucilia cuprina TaxID=7375 RepID=UPI001F06F558|nr:jerky protein homolog-like [Lucilia cuprina]